MPSGLGVAPGVEPGFRLRHSPGLTSAAYQLADTTRRGRGLEPRQQPLSPPRSRGGYSGPPRPAEPLGGCPGGEWPLAQTPCLCAPPARTRAWAETWAPG